MKDKDRRKSKKVVASGWGEEFIQFLAALAKNLPGTIFKNRMNSSFTFKSSWRNSSYSIIQIVQCKTASAARNLINFYPQTESTTFALSSFVILLLCLYLLLFFGVRGDPCIRQQTVYGVFFVCRYAV